MAFLSRGRRLAALAAVVSVTTIAAGVASGAAATAAQAGPNKARITYRVHPHTKLFKSGRTLGALPTPSQCVAAYGLACFTPSEIRKAYNVPAEWTGKGRSIAIVDAYGSPSVRQDLQIFSSTFGLPAADLHVYCPMGCPKTETAHKGQPLDWAGETSLDVQWSHAIAPEARINLVVAPNNYGNAINNAVRYVVDHHLGDVLSMSYGADESAIAGRGNNLQLKQAHAIFQRAVHQDMSLFASSGDGGASDGGPVVTAGYPASDPLVTAVGGTNLFTADDGTYDHETVWNDDDPTVCPYGCALGIFGATGGAPSTVFRAAPYQQALSGNAMRTTSDVSYNASVYTSVLVYEGFNKNPNDNGFYFYGGTSSGSPQWAGIGALADQKAGKDLGQLNPALYGIGANAAEYAADFHDVTLGNNAFFGPGFAAKVGYDIPTGLGSPNVTNLLGSLTR